jgi:DeoR family transcriptional regulator of aga operon
MIDKINSGKRRKKILEQLDQEGHVTTHTLSKIFNVSEVTIRNDLLLFEKKGLLHRTRGGALRDQRVSIDHNLTDKSKKHLIEKQKIARKAREFINAGDSIILDSGTTTQEIAKRFADVSDLTVITNGLNVAAEIARNRNVRLIMPGGILRQNSLSLVGGLAENSLRNYNCDKLFLGVDGIDCSYGISTPNLEEAQLNQVMIDVAKEVFIVTDSSKFLKRSFAYIAPIKKISTIITDRKIPQTEYNALINMGIDVILV